MTGYFLPGEEEKGGKKQADPKENNGFQTAEKSSLFSGLFVGICKFMISVQIMGRGEMPEAGGKKEGLGTVDNVDNLVHNSFLA